LIASTLTGCAANRTQEIAAARLGTAAAGVAIAPQPGECNRRILDPARAVGEEVRVLVDKYDAVLDAANNRLQNCYAFNEAIRAGLARN
jgi:hypothetical protein